MSATRSPWLEPAIDAYASTHSITPDAIQQALIDETARLGPRAQMQISPMQGAFMELLARAIGARNAVEVGTFTGYSALSVARALPVDGHLLCCDVSEEWTSIARRYWQEAKVDHKIDLYLAPALQTLDRLVAHGQAGSFDFAFIDADKENYWGYYERSLALLRPGGLIAIDNTLWSGRPADPKLDDPGTRAIRAFNQRLSKDSRVRISLVPIGDGMTLALKLRG